MASYIFILCPPFSGSTVLWKLLASSKNVSSMPDEGQFLPEVQDVLRKDSGVNDLYVYWPTIKDAWEKYWEDRPYKIEKSPPHLFRAIEIEKFFVPSYFVVMIRDPYAFCEGYSRRTSSSMEQSALFWQKCARAQRANIEQLQRVLFFTYEEFTQDISSLVPRLQVFLPDIGDLEWQAAYKSQSVYGPVERKISNLNDVKVGKLSADDINSINTVLQRDLSLMDFFEYNLLVGGIRHNLWRLKVRAKLNSNVNWERLRRLYKRRIDAG